MDALGVVQKLASGRLIQALHDALVTVAEEVVRTEKPGTVTLTLKIAPVAEMEAVTINEQIKTGLPVKKARGALLFAVGDGELHTSDPRQIPMQFRVVPETGELREVDVETGEVRQAE